MSRARLQTVGRSSGDVGFGSKADMCSAKGHVRSTPKADMCGATRDVRFVPIADISYAQKKDRLVSFLVTLRVEADLVDQLFNSSEKRLARALLLLANFGKDGRPEPIIAKVSQETLAEMIGTTRSRVSFFMNKFRKLGLIA